MKQLKALINKDVIKRMRHNDLHLTRIKNPTSTDLYTEGNIVVTDINIYLVFGTERRDWMSKSLQSISDEALIRYNPSGREFKYAYISSLSFHLRDKVSDSILAIYSTNIDISKIKTIKDLEDTWEKYRLSRSPEEFIKDER